MIEVLGALVLALLFGATVNLVDGGFSDWIKRIRSRRK